MIKVKEFFDTESYDRYEDMLVGESLETAINAFLSKNRHIEIVDIKYQRNISGFADGGANGTEENGSALLIYNEVVEDE